MWMSSGSWKVCGGFYNDKVRGSFSLKLFFVFKISGFWIYMYIYIIYVFIIIYIILYTYYIWLQIYSQFPWELSIYHPPPRVVRKNAATCVRCLAEDLGNTGTDVTGAEWPPTLPWRFVCSQTNGLIGKRGIGSDGCKVVVIILSSVSLMFPLSSLLWLVNAL